MKSQTQLTADALELVTGVRPTIEDKGNAFLFSLKDQKETAALLWVAKPYLMSGVGVDFESEEIKKWERQNVQVGYGESSCPYTDQKYYGPIYRSSEVLVGTGKYTHDVSLNTTDREPRITYKDGTLRIPVETLEKDAFGHIFRDAIRDRNTMNALRIFLDDAKITGVKKAFAELAELKKPTSEQLVTKPSLAQSFSRSVKQVTGKINRSLSEVDAVLGAKQAQAVRSALAGSNYSLLTAAA